MLCLMRAPLLVELDGDEALVELAHRRLYNLLEHAVLLTGDLHQHRIVDLMLQLTRLCTTS